MAALLTNSGGEAGSRVAVIQGEVHVGQGATLKALQPGEESATNPSPKKCRSNTSSSTIAKNFPRIDFLALDYFPHDANDRGPREFLH